MAALKDLVEFQLQSAKSLSLLLEKEKEAITQRISKSIEAIAHEKITLITQLQTTDERIQRHPDVKNLTDDPDLKPYVDEIRSVIHNCQQANDVNGEALKNAQLSFNKLNNLMKQSQGKLGMTYNSDGQTQNVSTLGTNVKA